MEDHLYSLIGDFHGSNLEEIKELGVEVVEDFDNTGIEEKLQPVFDKYAERDPFVKKTIELIQQLNSEY